MSSKPAGSSPSSPIGPDQRSLRKSALPARPRAVLEAILGKAGAILEEGLINALNEFDQQMFRLAEQALDQVTLSLARLRAELERDDGSDDSPRAA